MLHLQLRVPDGRLDRVVALLTGDDTVTNVAVFPDGYRKPPGALVLADVAREGANPVVAALRALDLHHDGSIMLSEPGTLFSDATAAAEEAAPGEPDDGIVWDIVENRVRKDSRLTWSYLSFLVLATLIAGAGRLLDQPILIVGAMVVGPEFSPVAAICLALARPRLALLPAAVRTLVLGFAIAIAIATPLWWIGYVSGLVSAQDAATGELTEFIIKPDAWSFVIALLAGIAGVLSLTASKSGPLVGVFISVTTVPAVGTIALCLGTGVWSEVGGAAVQLGVNVLGMLVAGTATLWVQRAVWSRVHRGARAGAF
ncbi:DUF389 domain-containing protein [Nocardioides iriomotensis]|uniref:DUF389 domain-containing protein n=1 Tax=Nocardioides iriomotensis TaxID=715784 RepID=A0A4Q5JAN4_9ACTN|nr:DUF389 domain-containing protein [Nocardioides iriomotensis]RYU15703.1 DUF389 domain-containing protein [Nocardioides iriomotensis]